MSDNKILQAIDYLEAQKRLFPNSFNVLSGHFDTAIAALQEKAEREKNDPLTSEQLRHMNNERVWDDYNQDYALVWVHSNREVTLSFKNGGTAGAEVGIVRKIYREKPVSK